MNTKKMLVIAVVAILAIAAVGVAVLYMQDDGDKDPLVDGEWDDILKMADGQRVNMGFYTGDVECKKFIDNVLIPEAKKLGITVTYQDYGPLAANGVKAEMDAGVTENGTWDLIWGDISPIAILVENGEYKYMWDGKWADNLPNNKFLTNDHEVTVKAGIPGYISGTAAEFSNGQTMFVYNQDFNAYTVKIGEVTVEVPYNCVVLLDNGTVEGFIKVNNGGATWSAGSAFIAASDINSTADLASAIDSASAYDVTALRAYMNANGGVRDQMLYGLPANFTELLNWIQLYPGQFTYPDPANAAATFHSSLIFQAIVYELKWNSGKNGWEVAPDREANVKAVNKLISDGAIKSEADFKTHFGYLYEYLEDLDPFINKMGYFSSGYIATINSKVVGNNDLSIKDFTDDTVMIGMSTVLSVDMRTAAYPYNIGTFSLDTGTNSQYYLSIPKNSSNKAAAMVVSNLFLEPWIQAKWFEMTGNGYNIDVNMKEKASDTQTIYEKYFGFTSAWTLYLPQDRLDDVTVRAGLTGLAAYMVSGWTSTFRSS